MGHRFGDLVKKYLAQNPGLNQAALAAKVGQDDAVISKMLGGERLANLNARQRVLDIINALAEEGLITYVEEADEMLEAAGWSRLLISRDEDVALINELKRTPLSVVPLDPLENNIYPNNGQHQRPLAILIVAVVAIGIIVAVSVWLRPNSRDICEQSQIKCLGDGWCRAQLSEADLDSHNIYLESFVDLDVEHFVYFNGEFAEPEVFSDRFFNSQLDSWQLTIDPEWIEEHPQWNNLELWHVDFQCN